MTQPTELAEPINLDAPVPKDRQASWWMPLAFAILAAVLAALGVSTLDRSAIRADVGRQVLAQPQPTVTVTATVKPAVTPTTRTYVFTPAGASVQTDGTDITNEDSGVNVTDATYFEIVVVGKHPTCTLAVDGDADSGITDASGPGWATCAWTVPRTP